MTAQEQKEAPAVEIVKQPGGRPDPQHHNGEMDRLKAEIDQTHAKMAQVRAALSGDATANTPAGQRRAALRAELDSLRSEQAGRKGTRGKVFDEMKQLQDTIAAKVKALQADKAKAPFKSASELDARVAQIEAQIETGSMKIVEERKALNEIHTLKRTRKTVEQFGAQQAEIDGLRARVNELRSTLDDPEAAAAHRRYDEIKQELDALAKEQEKTVGSRSKLQAQRNALSKKLDELYQARRDRAAAFHAENDKYFARVHAERERRQEAQRKERLEAEHARQVQEEQELREEAALPAFAKEIDDCDQLIRYFSGKGDEEKASTTTSTAVPADRMPSADVPEGAVVVPKKSEEEDYFAGTAKKKGKSRKGRAQDADESGALHVPFGMLSALLSLSIPPPANQADLPRVVENIRLKREYFVSNQARQTAENIRKADEKIAAQKSKREAQNA
ncbi:Similar to S.cerevisiae protein BFR1 (Component of mRNP complexes associated with polyribosomes) [Malassezia sympodialis ATCC 42132]|uniref:Similar to S.cerevisiae protein BFR1 (Component of mRNP complexes associated with polyribosomes) n=1 Tax=Malassezia sympodialis (strain ATCC 42132) TaxID=1230383 RepID=A0A1M8AC41_MALS4|nr:Similar to S.cerevisiae protein BFR1 (Component of mRNP complexes associated with polyribosomes) [Malassezia sympodialis ATCC 42132]